MAEITYAELLRLGVTQQSYSAQEAKAVLQVILGTSIVGNATTGVDPLQDGIWCLTGFGNNGKWREVGRSGTTMRFRAAQIHDDKRMALRIGREAIQAKKLPAG